MSVFFVVTPIVANMAWPLLASVIAGTLGTSGYSLVKKTLSEEEECGAANGVEMELKNSESLGETLGEEEKLVMERQGVTLTFTKGPDNRCRVHVEGRGKSQAELTRAGQEASNKIVQAYAYVKVMEEAKKKGMQLVKEEKEDGRIRLKFRKWG